MANKIKLENIVEAGFDTETGDKFLGVVDWEYVCGSCRHLIEKDDKFCPSCGEELTDSGTIEHYYEGKQLTDTQFKEELKQYGE